jgi:predicted amidohydrolase YtcJ
MKLLHNARIYTLNSSQPTASALVIDRERIIEVGSEALLDEYNVRVDKEDMDGQVILPGFTDSHLHLQHYALGLLGVDCETNTLAACLNRVSGRVSMLSPGEWVKGHGWNQANWPEGFGSVRDLDPVSPNNPVYLTAKSLHAAWVNTAALQISGINANTPDPRNGKIQRDEHGEPTGILFETAMELVNRTIHQPDTKTIATAISKAQTSLWRMGLTGVHDFDRRECFLALQQLNERGDLHLRVIKSIPVEDLPHAYAIGLRSGFGDDWLRIGSIKIFMDGALGTRTAAMFQPYLNEPGNRGMLNMDSEELFEIGRQAVEVGFSLAVHAIGDRANHEALAALSRLRDHEKANGIPALRHRIEHVQLIHPDDAGQLAKLNVVASMQPVHAPSDMLMADRYWGERASLAYAWRTQRNHGAILAFGSDAPVESPNPFHGLHAAVTRRRVDYSPGIEGWHPEQRLTMQEALEGYTIGGAYAACMDDRLGRLAPDYLADLIVLNSDLFDCDQDDLLTLESSATMIGGEWVWLS